MNTRVPRKQPRKTLLNRAKKTASYVLPWEMLPARNMGRIVMQTFLGDFLEIDPRLGGIRFLWGNGVAVADHILDNKTLWFKYCCPTLFGMTNIDHHTE
jgi:hypothetical protein